MTDGEEASTTAETRQAGIRKREDNRAGDDASTVGQKVDADVSRSTAHAGDPSSSREEPSVLGGSGRGKEAAAGVSPAPDGTYRAFSPMPTMENWPFNPSILGAGFDFGPLGPPPLVPVLIPAPFPSYFQIPGQDQRPPPGGVFAVPVMPMFGSVGAIPQGGFIPLSFNMPPVAPPVLADGQTPMPTSPGSGPVEAGRAGPQAEVRDAAAPAGLRQRHVAAGAAGLRAPAGAARPGEPQRQQQVVRRFQVGFQLDLLLILKLAVVVIVFNQDGTKDRLMLLLVLASIVYLYQTGALAPILRWISQSAQRAMMPPQQPPVPDGVRGPPQNVRDRPVGPEVREGIPPGAPVQEGAAAGQAGEGAPRTVGAVEQRAEQPPQNPNWWGFFKELQMIVVGFLTSLLPGFQHVD